MTETNFFWDGSHYDWTRGSMDLNAARADGIMGFTHKATESNTMQDAKFGEAMSRAVAAKMDFIAAYHVARTGPSASQQAKYCKAYVGRVFPAWPDHPEFFVQADVETWSYDNVSAATGEDIADALEQEFQRVCILYASKGQYGNSLSNTSHNLWNANYGSNSAGPYRAIYAARGGNSGPGWAAYSRRIPVLWQFGSQTWIGSQKTCDANAFRGSKADFAAMLNIGGSMVTDNNGAQGTSIPTWHELVNAILNGSIDKGFITGSETEGQPGWRVKPGISVKGATDAANAATKAAQDGTASILAALKNMSVTVTDEQVELLAAKLAADPNFAAAVAAAVPAPPVYAPVPPKS